MDNKVGGLIAHFAASQLSRHYVPGKNKISKVFRDEKFLLSNVFRDRTFYQKHHLVCPTFLLPVLRVMHAVSCILQVPAVCICRGVHGGLQMPCPESKFRAESVEQLILRSKFRQICVQPAEGGASTTIRLQRSGMNRCFCRP